MPSSTSSFKEIQDYADSADGSDVESETPNLFEGPNPNPPDPLLLTVDHCRSITDGRVCGLLARKCTRQGHGGEAPKGEVGAYGSLGRLRTSSAAPDGDPHAYLSMEAYERWEAQRLQQLMDATAELGTSETSKQAFERSPFKTQPPLVEEVEDEDDGISASVRHKTQSILKGMSEGLKKALKTPSKDGGVTTQDTQQAQERQERLDQARARKESLAEEFAKLSMAMRRETAAKEAAREEEETLKLEAESEELEAQIQALKTRQAALYQGGASSRTQPNQQGRSARLTQGPRGAPGLTAGGTAKGGATLPSPLNDLGLGQRPPSLSIPGGQDPDYKSDTVYGIPKILEESVFDSMVAQEFSEDLKGELQVLLPDVVSPTLGTFPNDKRSSDKDEMTAGFLNALVSHTNALHNRRGGYVRPDGSWNTVARVALNKVKTEDDFNKVIRSHHLQERQFAVKFSNRVRAVMIHYGYTPQDASAFADSSRYCLTCIRAQDLYGRLLAALEREVAGNGFKATKPFIDLHAAELTQFRSEGSRLGMWVHTYVYLRNLYQGEFWSPEKQELINRTFLHGHPTVDGGSSGEGASATGSGNKCNHCQGHAPGNCPFKEAGIGRGPSRRLARKAKEMGGRFATAAQQVIRAHQAEGNDAEETKEPD